MVTPVQEPRLMSSMSFIASADSPASAFAVLFICLGIRPATGNRVLRPQCPLRASCCVLTMCQSQCDGQPVAGHHDASIWRRHLHGGRVFLTCLASPPLGYTAAAETARDDGMERFIALAIRLVRRRDAPTIMPPRSSVLFTARRSASPRRQFGHGVG